MKLVLLPGMDGTAKLFRAFAAAVTLPTVALSYSNEGRQDPEKLARDVRVQLPAGPFVVVAESFSGPVALRLAAADKPEGLCGLVLVNSFATTPWRGLRTLALLTRLLPPRIPAAVIRHWMLEDFATDALVEEVRDVIVSVPPRTMAARLRAVADLSAPLPVVVPRLELHSTGDRLVRARSYGLPGPVERVALPGPHLLLQQHPEPAARAIETFAAGLRG